MNTMVTSYKDWFGRLSCLVFLELQNKHQNDSDYVKIWKLNFLLKRIEH